MVGRTLHLPINMLQPQLHNLTGRRIGATQYENSSGSRTHYESYITVGLRHNRSTHINAEENVAPHCCSGTKANKSFRSRLKSMLLILTLSSNINTYIHINIRSNCNPNLKGLHPASKYRLILKFVLSIYCPYSLIYRT